MLSFEKLTPKMALNLDSLNETDFQNRFISRFPSDIQEFYRGIKFML